MDSNTGSTGNNRNLPRALAGTLLIAMISLVGLAANMAPVNRQSDALTGISAGSFAPAREGVSTTGAGPAQPGQPADMTSAHAITGYSEKSAISEPLRSMKSSALAQKQPGGAGAEAEVENRSGNLGWTSTQFEGIDPLLQSVHSALNMPAPVTTFEGVSNLDGHMPPDTTGAVGPNDYVQWVNTSIQVFDKSGQPRLGPHVTGNTFWSMLGGVCYTNNQGDPVVVYDSIADRWLLGQFGFPNFSTGPYYECLAVSTGPDPTGSYYEYAFLMSNSQLNDYPKLAVWPDAYYMSTNNFVGGTNYIGHSAVAFDRAAMLAGQPTVTFQKFDEPTFYGNMLPAGLDGPTLPPAGSPGYFGSLTNLSTFTLFKFHVDWSNPANSTFLGTNIPVALFNANLCGGSYDCIPQPGTTQRLEPASDRLMYRLAYRNMGSYEALLTNHTVDVDGTNHAGIRWYEIRNPATNPYVYQQGTYAPDADHRWMGSIAEDRFGNIALGYSVSGSGTYPSIRYAGRLSTDPLGTLTQGEQTLQAGGGSQAGGYPGSNRWGDYSAMSVDPGDDCTFWYTQEYYSATGAGTWQTRIGAFRFPQCAALATPTPLPTVIPPTVPPAASPTPLPSPTAGTPVPTPTSCVMTFPDVHQSDYFYAPVQYLYCARVVSGFPDNTFRPYATTTRGQLAKIVVLAENWNLYIPLTPTFSDVGTNQTFFAYIETAHHRGIVNGFGDGTFRPSDPVTRGQLSKIVVLARGWAIYTPPSPSFTDVATTYGFYTYIETAHYKGIISGYQDGTFKPDNHAVRGQIAKIVYNAIMTP